ncbi:MAG TPA: cyclic nucleotide-binding domain-containing protein, partial [Roseimicrobium sp.]|nr:cyclic nucleotide-binding domain-containing protein [Roseimicrobium sp.]
MHSLLQRVPILAGLNGDAIELLTGHAREAALREGEFVVREGETGNRFFLLQSGEVRVVKHAGAPN